MSFTEIAQALQLSSEDRRELRSILRALIEERKIVKPDRRNYSLPDQGNIIVGKVHAHPDGYGFLIPEDEKQPDIFLSRRDLKGLMHQDRVALHLGKKERRGKHRQRGLQVLERAQRRVVGRYAESRNDHRVIPDDPRLTQEIQIPGKATGGARPNQIVLAEITQYATQRERPLGRIIKIIGDADDPRLDSEIIIHKYDLPDAFPPAVLKEAEAVPREIPTRVISNRQDLRSLNFFTVDGETARDFDDAIAISKGTGGGVKLWVAIADVSHYVPEGSELDGEALQRGTSVYFPERALPMIPPQLSNGICSLNPKEDRLCMTAAIDFDNLGRIKGAQFFPSVIHSQGRMTYTMVKKMLMENDRDLIALYPAIYEDLQPMADLCRKLRGRRMERGSLDFDLPEPQVILDVQGQIEEIVKAERHLGHQIIEEFMIATNEAVAHFLAQEGVPFLRRIHEPPDPVKVEEFKEFIAHLGYRFSPKKEFHPQIFRRILEQVRGKPEEKSVNYLLLRSMKQARYSEKELGHFALASTDYLHFTSPIRRYPDLVVHRILKELISSQPMTEKRRQSWGKKLPGIAEHSSQRERVAMEAEREIIERKKVQFMKDKVGQEFFGYISGVRPFGIFIELEDFFVEGLIHLTRLPEDQYQFWELRHALVGRHSKRTFRLGDRVHVRVEAANLERRQVDFGLIQ
jgi:ribonuclease R